MGVMSWRAAEKSECGNGDEEMRVMDGWMKVMMIERWRDRDRPNSRCHRHTWWAGRTNFNLAALIFSSRLFEMSMKTWRSRDINNQLAEPMRLGELQT